MLIELFLSLCAVLGGGLGMGWDEGGKGGEREKGW